MNTLSLKESNDKIIELLQSNKPFYISRMGIGAETYIPYIYIKQQIIFNIMILRNYYICWIIIMVFII